MSTLIYKQFPTPLRLSFLALTIGLGIYIFVRSLMPVDVNIDANNMDKLVHFSAYFLLASFALAGFANTKPWVVLLWVIGFGGLIEILQGLVHTGRSSDILDFLANTMGAFCALAAWSGLSELWSRFRV